MIHLVTGGSGSGKSAYAEQCILDFGGTRRVYIATMQPFGAEGQARIARHRKMRAAKKFSTIECYTNLKEVELEPGSDVLLECMSNLTANEIFDPSGARERAPSCFSRFWIRQMPYTAAWRHLTRHRSKRMCR